MTSEKWTIDLRAGERFGMPKLVKIQTEKTRGFLGSH